VKPKVLKVKFKDETFESVLVTPRTLVKNVISDIVNKVITSITVHHGC
jgi:hypothetical protein